jgi:hypothetical protein
MDLDPPRAEQAHHPDQPRAAGEQVGDLLAQGVLVPRWSGWTVVRVRPAWWLARHNDEE